MKEVHQCDYSVAQCGSRRGASTANGAVPRGLKACQGWGETSKEKKEPERDEELVSMKGSRGVTLASR
ncbi:hypothetical protein EYF80_024748 [Liparis tanakae]|uniref:Uncharacterized protein n=1 Tax=Liparis tanakae TaxID=230148 RepID=A0A4Z2HGK8_9TELE|nr:hypothetical protein EYF80_024748 [Liparis tanakae]